MSTYLPNGGMKRDAYSKSFSDATIKAAVTYLCQVFNFKFVDKKYETELPVAVVDVRERQKIEIVLTNAD